MSEICRDNADFAYNGQTVRVSDAEKILFRWKLDDGRYHVIYGDLRSEMVADRR